MTSIPDTRNKEYITCFPTICVEVPTLIKSSCNIELVWVTRIFPVEVNLVKAAVFGSTNPDGEGGVNGL